MPVLSIRRSVDQLDQAEERFAVLQRAVSRAIQTVAQYAVELRSDDVRAFRANLERLAAMAEGVSGSEETEHLQADFRGELRTYQTKSHAEVARVREEMAAMLDSMQSIMTSVGGSTDGLQSKLSEEFASLEAIAESGDINAIRGAIHHAVETAARSCEEARRAQELLTAQLQDEIRNLHKAVDLERKANLCDPMTGVWNRGKMDARIKDLILLNEAFCVFFVGLPSLIRITRNDPRFGPELLRAVTYRLYSVAGKNGELGMLGRWSEGVFAIIFNLPLSGAPTTPSSLQQSLSGAYAIQLDGANHELVMEVQVHAAERPKNFAESAFYLQLGQAAFHTTAQ